MTFCTLQRRRLFVVEAYVRLFLQTLYRYRRGERFELHAFVVMPEHIHLLLTPARDITVWQRGFTDHRIRDEMDFTHHRNYIHRNPVERGLVNDPREYRYCSAFPGFKLDFWPSAA